VEAGRTRIACQHDVWGAWDGPTGKNTTTAIKAISIKKDTSPLAFSLAVAVAATVT